MEKAVLKTLIYADIFDYPLKAWEVHKWLIGKKATLKQVEKTLKDKNLKSKIKNQKGYYFFSKRKQIVRKRINREKESKEYLKVAKIAGFLLKLIPWVKLVGISGSLAMRNSSKKDDVDLFVITAKKRLFLSRLALLFILSLIRKRRKVTDSKKKAAGKICINLLLEENNLAQNDSNIYLAHEVLQMVPLWQRDDVYSQFLEANNFAFKHLPNWISSQKQHQKLKVKDQKYFLFNIFSLALDLFEDFARWIQLKLMTEARGMERITNHSLYFHPENHGIRVLREYQKRSKKIV